MPGVCTYENTAYRRCHQKSAHSSVKWAARRLTRFVWGLYIWKYSRRKRNKALQTKTTGKEQMIKTYGERAACRSACMDFRGASVQLQLHNLNESKSKSLTRLAHEDSHVLRWLKNGNLFWHRPWLCERVVRHIHWEFFCRYISFRFGQFVALLTEVIFSFNFWETASIVLIGEAKIASFLDQFLSIFLAFVASNSRLTCVRRDRMRAEWVVAALLWFYKHDSGSFALKQMLLPQAAPWWWSMSWHMLPSRLQDDAAELQRSFQVSPKLLGFGEACFGILKVSCCGVAS